MKNLILFCIITVLLPCLAHSQTDNSRPDTIVYGDVAKNYPGGQDAYNQYLSKNGSYPEPAKSANIQGCVYIRFVIEKDSTLSSIHLCSGAGSGMDETAVKLITNSGKWIPSIIDGKNIRTHCIVPVRFSLLTDEDKISKSGIYGSVFDISQFNQIKKIESLGIPVSEAFNYINKNIQFMGKVYGTKALSDTVFIMTCGSIDQSNQESYVNVVLFGKGAFTKNLNKQKLTNCLVTGVGSVISSNDIPVIIINDDNKCKIIEPATSKFHWIYDFKDN